jgi:hypothetical protein
LLPTKNGQPLFPSFDSSFVHVIELEEFAAILANLALYMTLPEISGEAKSAVLLSVQCDVIQAFELDHVIAFGFVLVVSPSASVLEVG